MAATRRLFLKTAATGALLSPVTFLRANGANGEEPALGMSAPDLKTGEVIRTQGQLLPSGEFLREERRLVPVAGTSDVLVCGGGPAGIAAALAAARQGAKTQLLEFAGCLGGVWTAGMLTKILDAGNKSGIMKEILKALSAQGSDVAKTSSGTVYDPELAKRVLEEMCVEAGIEIQLHTLVVGAVTDEQNRLVAVITESKSGRQAWLAERFIDCTGDGDLAAQAGCQFDVGLNDDCDCQPMSLMALLTGIDPQEVEPYIRETGREAKQRFLKLMRDAGINPSYRAPTLRHLHDGIFSLMTNHEYGVSAFDAGAISKATINARKEVFEIVAGLKKLGGPWSGIAVVATAEQIGVREGRRIKGRYTLTGDDLVSGLRHPQAIARAKFPFDVHSLELAGNPEEVNEYRKQGVKSYDIPYPALVSADVDNLLMAGRCISGDFLAHSSYRVTGNAVPMGEAAGKAAALSITQQVMPHEIEWQTARSNS
ncbi:ribulose-1,5-biphosphate synthetase [Polystyrenella longa]|uniref:Ribulose-1,5-biphosphate synthetase n=1 Tax=Polystyrenella longa TaxID=2528007 RepID=A0A518CHW0_9PLAN|nr:FAD-dependent oxidoreductase [Polystyrenella longa]QDU78818.1 ribulose-1,5-biphosphate synthetase [Polystyrenella longa]